MNTHIDVALFLWNPDVIELMSVALRERNLKSRGVEPSEGEDKIEDLILSWDPNVVVFDLDPPYDRSAAIARHLHERFPDCSFVITCADSARALKKAPWLSRYRLFEKPYGMEDLANSVRSMVRRAPKTFVAVS
jgi:DNA-binding NtrC family response regulator